MNKYDVRELKELVILSQKLDNYGISDVSKKILAHVIKNLRNKVPLEEYEKDIHNNYRALHPEKYRDLDFRPEDMEYEEKEDSPDLELIPIEQYKSIIDFLFPTKRDKERNIHKPKI